MTDAERDHINQLFADQKVRIDASIRNVVSEFAQLQREQMTASKAEREEDRADFNKRQAKLDAMNDERMDLARRGVAAREKQAAALASIAASLEKLTSPPITVTWSPQSVP